MRQGQRDGQGRGAGGRGQGRGRRIGGGRRNSFPRQMVLQFLQQNRDRHFSAREIHQNLFQNGIQVGIASVYRNLDVLGDEGVIRQVNLGSGESVYQFAIETSCHWHLVWNDRVKDISPDKELVEMLNRVRDKLSETHGVEISDTVLNFFVKQN